MLPMVSPWVSAPWEPSTPSRAQIFPVDALDPLQRTPLMHASFAKSAEAVVWLVQRKANVETLGWSCGLGAMVVVGVG